jgi:MATE family multidrug resistance protein
MIRNIKNRWAEKSGYHEIFKIAFPLILSTGSWSLQHFIDRMFLTWYSPAAIAAALPASMVNWTLMSVFVGIAAYVNTFVAQYYGAKRLDRIGPAVWQGIYLSISTVAVVLPFYALAEGIFTIFNHTPEVIELEIIYFRILLYGVPFAVMANAISSFFSGLGKTWTVMWVNFLGTGINILLDYLLIFGYLGFPEMGIAGAGWATAIAVTFMAAIFFFLFSKRRLNLEYHTLNGWRFDKSLFRRLIRYGLPNGLQFLLEILAFTIFILLIGNIGMAELAASNIAININSLAFMPIYGLTIAVSTLVGQYLGDNKPALAEKATWSAFHLAFAFFGLLALGYFFFPQVFIWPFAVQANSADFGPIRQFTEVLLRFVAVYCLFDAGNMIFSGALKGAGDTRFVAVASVGLSWGVMIVPSLTALYVFDSGLYGLWLLVTLYIVGLCFVFLWRFKKGFWKSMRVIETAGEVAEKAEGMAAAEPLPDAVDRAG